MALILKVRVVAVPVPKVTTAVPADPLAPVSMYTVDKILFGK